MNPQENELQIKLADIVVGERLRKDYGDLSDLDTIETVGLIQPLVIQRDSENKYHLVAGGRRYAKLTALGVTEVYHGATCDPQRAGYVYRDEVPVDVQKEIELYENLGRKQLVWQERVRSIAEIHRLKKHRAALDSETWGQAETGAEVGLTYGMVSYMLTIDEELDRPGSKIGECKGVTEAIRYLAERREDIAKQQLAELTSKVVVAPQVVAEAGQIDSQTPQPTDTLVVPLSKMLFHGDMIDLCRGLGPQAVDHIVTDWPYAIDMSNLQQENTGMDVSRVEAEHDDEENLIKYPDWLIAMYDILKPSGFCICWYDNVNFSLIRQLAEDIGFRAQRWPLVWIKTSPCLNQMASKNWTKATEFAIVLSKGNATLQKIQSKNFWSGPRANTTSNPFAKPKGLWQWIYDAICLQGDVVLDPFMGENSAGLAAIDFGLRPIGFESNRDHFNQALLNTRQLYTQLTKGNVTFV